MSSSSIGIVQEQSATADGDNWRTPCEWCGAESATSVPVGRRHADACAECAERLAHQSARVAVARVEQLPMCGSDVGTERQRRGGWWASDDDETEVAS